MSGSQNGQQSRAADITAATLPEGPTRPVQDPEAPGPLDRRAAARLDEEAQGQAWAGINSS